MNSITKKSFGSRLREIREAESLTRSQLESICGINASTLKGIELGKHYPSLEILTSLLSNELFSKYAVWLTTGKTDTQVTQVTPKRHG